jgi:hypothetical protein
MPFATTIRHIRLTLLEWMIVRAVPLLHHIRPRARWKHSLGVRVIPVERVWVVVGCPSQKGQRKHLGRMRR